jgi:hypothetical protein
MVPCILLQQSDSKVFKNAHMGFNVPVGTTATAAQVLGRKSNKPAPMLSITNASHANRERGLLWQQNTFITPRAADLPHIQSTTVAANLPHRSTWPLSCCGHDHQVVILQHLITAQISSQKSSEAA